MSISKPCDVRHQRSPPQGMDLVMQLALSVDGDIIDQLPLPQTCRPADRGTDGKRAYHKSLVCQSPASCTPGSQTEMNPHRNPDYPHRKADSAEARQSTPLSAILGPHEHSRASSRGVPTPVRTPVRTPQPEDSSHAIEMSLVSPPFTPSTSQLDLSGHKLTSPEPIQLPPSTAEVRSKLDDTLPQVFCESRARIPTTTGEEIFLHVYRNNVDAKEHLAIVFGQDIHSQTLFAKRDGETEHDRMTRGAYTGKLYPGRETSGPETERAELQEEPTPALPGNQDVLCRIHSECYTGETAWSARCDCGEQLDEAARLMSKAGRGVIVYLRQEGRGIGLGEKLKAYNLQDLGADTVQANLMLRHPADGRSFGLATAILLDLGLDHIRLMTNNPDKIVAVEGKNKEITVTQRVPMIPLSWQKKGGFQSAEVDKYLATKIERMGHLLDR